MQPLEKGDPETQSLDVVSENIARLRELFPDAWREGNVDFDVLRQLLGGAVDEREEKYGLNWHGKRQAREIALTPSSGTLRPCPDESVDWETTKNVVIEGDNLEVLKLLQKSYAARVKMIYIDPPYNTANDFIYPDDYRDGIKNFLRITGQLTSTGVARSSRPETGGRLHTAWLSMMYPRLRLARTLLREDGVIFISIDDTEVANLRLLCNDVFGEENFLATFVRRRRMATGMRDTPVSPDHEYVLAYARNIAEVALYGVARRAEDFPLRDRKGSYRSTDLTVGMTKQMRPNQFYSIDHPGAGTQYWPPAQRVWRFEPATMRAHIEADNIIWPDDNPGRQMTRPRFKTRFDPGDAAAKSNPVSTWIEHKAAPKSGDSDRLTLRGGLNEEATKEVRELLDEQVLEYPKPVSLIKALCALATQGDDLVMDFFAGSGSTGHAVWLLNQQDGGKRRFVMVQIQEQTERRDYPTISAITRERLRRAAVEMRHAGPLIEWDAGFRSFHLAASNVRPWSADADRLEQALLDSVIRVEPDRTESDLLFELLLKRGLDLATPINVRVFAGRTVHCVGGGALIACLARSLDAESAEAIAQGIIDWPDLVIPPGDRQCVFMDDAFANDVARVNLSALLEQHGIKNVRAI